MSARSISPRHLVLASAAFFGAAIGFQVAGFGEVHTNEYCFATPAPQYLGNCSCEVQGGIWACSQSMANNGMWHLHYECLSGPHSCDDTPTTWCGKKWDCSPKTCDDPTRTCIARDMECPASVKYGCTTL